MSKPDPILSPDHVARALRAAGFVPLPRLWVRGSDMPAIHAIADRHGKEVNAIRTAVRARYGIPEVPRPDPRIDKNAAWEAAERLRTLS